jgi:hypothetical protein
MEIYDLNRKYLYCSENISAHWIPPIFVLDVYGDHFFSQNISLKINVIISWANIDNSFANHCGKNIYNAMTLTSRHDDIGA